MKRPGYSRVIWASAMLIVASALGCSLTKGNPDKASLLQSPRHVQTIPEPRAANHDGSQLATSKLVTIQSLGKTVVDDAKYLLTSPLRIDAKGALVIGGIAAGIGGLMVADEDIRDAFQRNRGDTGDDVAEALKDVGSAEAVFAANIGLIGAGFWFREQEAGDKLLQTAMVSLEAQLFTEAAAGLTKLAVGRNRPNKGRGSDFYTPFKNFDFDRSFPSSHAARAFAVASVFADRYEHPVPFLSYTTATLISLSRIYSDDHWASDVFAGAALGFVIGKTLSWRHRYKDKKNGLTFLPYLPNAEATLGLTIQYSFN